MLVLHKDPPTNKRGLLIIGASGHGRVVADIARKMGSWERISFLDDDSRLEAAAGFEVIGRTYEALSYINDMDFVVAIGNNETRKRIQSQLRLSGASMPTLVHPQSIIGYDVKLGPGSVIMAGSVISCGSKLGEGCIINTGATIDHDNVIGDYVHVSPGAHIAGTVTIGEGCWIGIGAAVVNGVTIVGGCTVGAGAVVIEDLTRPGTYVGVPVRRLSDG